MKIIGHRGAAGLVLENTLKSINTAKALGVDAIEIDVRLTKDQKLIVSHDPTLRRTAGKRVSISGHTVAELKQYVLKDGQITPTLSEALEVSQPLPLLIEAKASGWADELARELKNTLPEHAIVIARDHQELAKFHQMCPQFKTYLVQRFNPVDVLQALQDAHKYNFTGVDLNFWLLNPWTYWLAKRYQLEIIVYTVDSKAIARFLLWLFPDIAITSNRPDRLQILKRR